MRRDHARVPDAVPGETDARRDAEAARAVLAVDREALRLCLLARRSAWRRTLRSRKEGGDIGDENAMAYHRSECAAALRLYRVRRARVRALDALVPELERAYWAQRAAPLLLLVMP
jgi:hypothetical protein